MALTIRPCRPSNSSVRVTINRLGVADGDAWRSSHASFHVLHDVVKIQPQMLVLGNALRRVMRRIGSQQGHHMADIMRVDERLDLIERADDDHGVSASFLNVFT